MTTAEAEALLQQLQRESLRAIGLDGPPLSVESTRRLLQETISDVTNAESSFLAEGQRAALTAELKAFIEAIPVAPASLEDPFTHWLLVTLSDDLKEAIAGSGQTLDVDPLLGSLPLGHVNARTIRVPDQKEYIVVFEADLFVFALLLSKVVAQCFPLAPRDDGSGRVMFNTSLVSIQAAIDESPDTRERFWQALRGYAVTGWVGGAPTYTLGGPRAEIATLLRRSLELFVLGHEYGHILAGHLERPGTGSAVVGNTRVESVKFDWAQEFEADSLGMDLMSRVIAQQHLPALGHCGPDLLFSAIDAIQNSVSVLRTGYEAEGNTWNSSHPPPVLRRAELRKRLSVGTPPERSVAKLGAAVEYAIDYLWLKVCPGFRVLHDKGQRPGRKWVPLPD